MNYLHVSVPMACAPFLLKGGIFFLFNADSDLSMCCMYEGNTGSDDTVQCSGPFGKRAGL